MPPPTLGVSVPGLKVTAFGPFGAFASNPSLDLARAVFAEVEELEVSYATVDDWVRNQVDQDWTALLALGVDGKATVPRLETIGRNTIGPTVDVLGSGPLSAEIEVGGPSTVRAGLWNAECLRDLDGWTVGDDAGSYLCNYLLYRSIRAFPGRRIGFLHIPPFEKKPFDEQIEVLVRVTAAVAPTLLSETAD